MLDNKIESYLVVKGIAPIIVADRYTSSGLVAICGKSNKSITVTTHK